MKQPLGNGVRVGDFYIVSMLSDHGGFSITYLAEGPDGRRVALKELFLSDICERENDGTVKVRADKRAEFDEVLAAFRLEGRRLSELGVRHRHIVNVFDVFDAKGTAYLVMEYVSGQQLHKWTDGPCVPELRRVRTAMTALCDALQYLHENHSLFHFDLKSTNVMIEAGSERAVLIDFGTSRHYDANSHQTRRRGLGGYSPGYMAPEYINDDVDGSVLEDAVRIDVFGLGATLFRILTRREPPVATSDALIARMLGEAGLPAEFGPYVEAVKAAMRYEPWARLQSVAEFGRMLGFELEHHVDGDVVKTVRRKYEAEPKTECSPGKNAAGVGEDPEQTDPEMTVRRPATGDRSAANPEEATIVRPVTNQPVLEPATIRTNDRFRPPVSQTPGRKPSSGGGGKNKWTIVLLVAALLVLMGLALWLGFSSRPRVDTLTSDTSALIQENYDSLQKLMSRMSKETPAATPAEAEAVVEEVESEELDTLSFEEVVEPMEGAAIERREYRPERNLSTRGVYEFPNGGNLWNGPLYAGKPDGVGELNISSRTTIGDSVLYAGWTVRNAVFEDGLFISGDVYDAANKYLYTYIP